MSDLKLSDYFVGFMEAEVYTVQIHYFQGLNMSY